MTRIIEEGRKRRSPLLLMALMGVIAGALLGGVPLGSAAKGPSVDDYSQCADGKADTNTGCDSWINGILNSNNSSYHEDQVTPQRVKISGLSAGSHTLKIRYLIRKGGKHAYDSLATWNHTQSDAQKCLGFSGPALTACNNDTSGTPSTTAIPNDLLEVPAACNTTSDVTSAHQLPGQQLVMWGGTLQALTTDDYLGVFTDSEGEYQTLQVKFTTGANATVYLFFGGHLAAGLTPADNGSPRGWGAGCGASSISGGPYHIILDGLDGSSLGNRDNQIMSNAVLPLLTPGLSTTPTSSTTFSVTLNDSLDVGIATAGGTATFKLYGPFSSAPTSTSCVDSGMGANLLYTASNVAVSGGTANTNAVAGAGKTVSPTTASYYAWVVEYSGDAAHSPPIAGATSPCGDETSLVTPPSAVVNNGT